MVRLGRVRRGVSVVDDVLHGAGSFAAMDFATRDRYRHAIEPGRAIGHGRVDVARQVVAMAATRRRLCRFDVAAAGVAAAGVAAAGGLRRRSRRGGQGNAQRARPASSPRQADGCWLLADGRPAFEHVLRHHPPLSIRLRRAYAHQATGAYLGSIALVTALILAIPLAMSALGGTPTIALIGLALLGLVPASDLAIALVNRVVTDLLGPMPLARLDLDDGVPGSLRTLVVGPTLLADEADVGAQVGQLEVHYLANPRRRRRFALLGLARRARRADAGRRRHPRHRGRRDRPAQRAPRRGAARRGTLPALPPQAALERAEAAGWAGSASAASWINQRPAARVAGPRHAPDGSAVIHAPGDVVYVVTLDATRGCRAVRSGGWSARWRTRSTGRSSIR